MPEDRLYLLSEAAELTGSTVEAIRQRIRRRTIRAIKGNDGRVRVRLTEEDIAALKAARPSGQPSEQPSGRQDEDSNAIKALRDHLNATREDLARERTEHAAERDRLLQDVAQARAAVDRLTVEIDRGRAELDRERQHGRELAGQLDAAHQRHAEQVEQLRGELARANREHAAKLEELQKAVDLSRRPWWRRLIGR
jgi:hypothetical protein